VREVRVLLRKAGVGDMEEISRRARLEGATRLVIEVEANDRVKAVEMLREFLLRNSSITVIVYAR